MYLLPVETQPLALAFGGNRFCLTGTNGIVMTFSDPGEWTVESWGFPADAELSGVAYFNFNP